MKKIIFRGVKNSLTVNRHFRIDPIAMNWPGVFQYDFVSSGHMYSYGFALSYTQNIFLAEWMYLCDDNKSFLAEIVNH